MRLTCPHCGDRDLREFSYKGAALALSRPSEAADPADWDEYLHIRDNLAGPMRELWYHGPCGCWLVAERDTVSHAVLGTSPAREAAR